MAVFLLKDILGCLSALCALVATFASTMVARLPALSSDFFQLSPHGADGATTILPTQPEWRILEAM